MGLWDKIKGELIDIIEFLDESNDTIVHRFERYQNEIKNGAKLIVRESQTAVFVREGVLADIFPPGTFTLKTENLPILSTLAGWKYGFDSPFKAEVYFINTKMFTNQGWGTSTPILMRDPEFGPIELRARGTYCMRVDDPAKFVTDIAGTNSHFGTDDLSGQLRALVVSKFTDAVAEMKIPVLDLAANYNELGDQLNTFLTRDFLELGLEISKFTIVNISLPPELTEAMRTRSKMNIIGNMQQYTQFQTANAIGDAAKNQGGAGAAMGAGLGMGMGMGMAQAVSGAMNPGMGGVAPPPPVPGQYYIAVNGQQQGPFALQQLQQMAASGQFRQDTMVWRQGMAAWAAASQQGDLSSVFAGAPPPLPPQ